IPNHRHREHSASEPPSTRAPYSSPHRALTSYTRTLRLHGNFPYRVHISLLGSQGARTGWTSRSIAGTKTPCTTRTSFRRRRSRGFWASRAPTRRGTSRRAGYCWGGSREDGTPSQTPNRGTSSVRCSSRSTARRAARAQWTRRRACSGSRRRAGLSHWDGCVFLSVCSCSPLSFLVSSRFLSLAALFLSFSAASQRFLLFRRRVVGHA
ncbi:hypothetical protein B0H13DRAFT_2290015, partial [Mycena leptocephala]